MMQFDETEEEVLRKNKKEGGNVESKNVNSNNYYSPKLFHEYGVSSDNNNYTLARSSSISKSKLIAQETYLNFVKYTEELDFLSALNKQNTKLNERIIQLQQEGKELQIELDKLLENKKNLEASIVYSKNLTKEIVKKSELISKNKLSLKTIDLTDFKIDSEEELKKQYNAINANINEKREQLQNLEKNICKMYEDIQNKNSLIAEVKLGLDVSKLALSDIKKILKSKMVNILDLRNGNIDYVLEILSNINVVGHNLSYINLSNSGIGKNPSGLGVILEVLAKSSTILHLDLSCNSITDEACELIIKILQINKNLQLINLSGNSITKVAFTKCLEAAHNHPALKLICFANNDIYLTDNEFKAIKQSIPVGSKLIISVSHNYIVGKEITDEHFLSRESGAYSRIKESVSITSNNWLFFLMSNSGKLGDANCIIEKINDEGQRAIESYPLMNFASMNISSNQLLTIKKENQQAICWTIRPHEIPGLVDNIKKFSEKYGNDNKQFDYLKNLMDRKSGQDSPILSRKNYMLTRIWPPKYNHKRSSLPVVIMARTFNDQTNVGHASAQIFINHNIEEIFEKNPIQDKTVSPYYISHWPEQRNTLTRDQIAEGPYSPTLFAIFSLDAKKMKEYDEKTGRKIQYSFYNSGKDRNCSGLIYEILKIGGLFQIILTDDDKLNETIPITPNDITILMSKAVLIERIIYPYIQNLFELNAQEYMDNLLRASQSEYYSTFCDRYPDHSMLYLDPYFGVPALLKNFENIISANRIHYYSQLLLETVEKQDYNGIKMCLENKFQFEKNTEGYNVFHRAILKQDERALKILISGFDLDSEEKMGEARKSFFETKEQKSLREKAEKKLIERGLSHQEKSKLIFFNDRLICIKVVDACMFSLTIKNNPSPACIIDLNKKYKVKIIENAQEYIKTLLIEKIVNDNMSALDVTSDFKSESNLGM